MQDIKDVGVTLDEQREAMLTQKDKDDRFITSNILYILCMKKKKIILQLLYIKC